MSGHKELIARANAPTRWQDGGLIFELADALAASEARVQKLESLAKVKGALAFIKLEQDRAIAAEAERDRLKQEVERLTERKAGLEGMVTAADKRAEAAEATTLHTETVQAMIDYLEAATIERCAKIVDQCNREGPYMAIAAASRIRALVNKSPGGA